MSEIKKLTIGQDELDLSKYTPNDGTLTIQQNGTTVDTFTANSSTNKTVNIETIYSEDVSSTQPIAQVVSTAMIQDEAVTTTKIDDGVVTSAKIDWSTFTDGSTYFTIGSLLIQFGTADFGNQSYSSVFWGSTNRSANQNLHITFPKAFSAKPYYVGIQPVGSTQMAIAYASGTADDSSTRTRDFAVLVPTSQTGTLRTKVQWIAIGPA